MGTRLLIAGATGLVGSAVTRIALDDKRIESVTTWGRRPTDSPEDRVAHWGPSDGDLLKGLKDTPVDAVICCLGTTMSNVNGDKSAFLHVDHDLVVGLGKWASTQGAVFCLVSSHGADANSSIFYNKVKGKVEHELSSMTFPALHIFRPSILDGPRSENRMGERIALSVMRFLTPILPKATRPMPYRTLATALVEAAVSGKSGTLVHSYVDILELAGERA